MICTYRDYAGEEEESGTTSAGPGGEAKMDLSSMPTPTGVSADVPEQVVFPVKLHSMLGQVERLGLDHVVGWAPHGRCFLIRNKDAFVNQILAMWFRQSKFASFQRQLNLYGFKRITTGRDKGGYYHEFFLRGKAFLCQRMERVKIKGSKPGRVKAYADTEPDFYSFPPLPEEPKIAQADHRQGSASGTCASASSAASVPAAMAGLRSDPIELPPLRSLAALGGNSRTLPEIRPIERELSLRDFGIGDISFLSNQPQPMTLSRNSPPLHTNAEDEQKYQSPGPLAMREGGSEGKQDDDLFAMMGISNDWSAFPAVVHPMLQSSGRTGLVNLRDSSSTTPGLLGTGLNSMGGIDANQLFANLTNTNRSGVPPLGFPSLASIGHQQAHCQDQNLQQQLQQLQQGDLADMPSMDMFQMQSDMLSEFLPTAQSLALADLFDNGMGESPSANAGGTFDEASIAFATAEVASAHSGAGAGSGIGMGPLPQAEAPSNPLLLFPRQDGAAGYVRHQDNRNYYDRHDGEDQAGRTQGGRRESNQNMFGYH